MQRAFLYLVVINTDNGQFSVAQMISTSHDAVTIAYFLGRWAASGAPHPKEFICDSAKAIILAILFVFTACRTIEEYCNACDGEEMPTCFVRIDAAHFIKPYATLTKQLKSKKVRIFYKAAIGLLIGTRLKETATKIVRAILLSARCEVDGEGTKCYEARQWIIKRLDPSREEKEDDENDAPKEFEADDKIPLNDSIFTESTFDNKWYQWAKEIDRNVVQIAKEEDYEDHVNAYKCEEIAKKLINDLRSFNLWSNICIDKFGYGRDAASSSPVESEIKNIKHPLMKSQSSRLRPDAFIDLHINHWVKGRMNMIGAKEDALIFKEKSTIMNESSCVSEGEVSA